MESSSKHQRDMSKPLTFINHLVCRATNGSRDNQLSTIKLSTITPADLSYPSPHNISGHQYLSRYDLSILD